MPGGVPKDGAIRYVGNRPSCPSIPNTPTCASETTVWLRRFLEPPFGSCPLRDLIARQGLADQRVRIQRRLADLEDASAGRRIRLPALRCGRAAARTGRQSRQDSLDRLRRRRGAARRLAYGEGAGAEPHAACDAWCGYKNPARVVPFRITAPVYFESAQQFRAWLAAHAHAATELLVGFRKVGSGLPSMRWSESVDQALCYGWIDGVRKRVDEDSYTIRFTPRQARSVWNAVNIEKVAALRAEGLMTPAGEAAFALRSEARSLVHSYERWALVEMSPDAAALFRQNAAVWAYFEACPSGYRQRMLHPVVSAKKQETRDGRWRG